MRIYSLLRKEYESFPKNLEIYGIFLCGNQNYLLSQPDDAVTTKVLVVPKLEDLLNEKRRPRVVKGCVTNAACEIRDIYAAIGDLKEQNTESLEMIFTDYAYINPAFSRYHMEFQKRAEELTRLDEKKTLKKMLKKLTAAKKSVFENTCREGYDASALLEVWKYACMIDKYTSGKGYREIMHCQEIEAILEKKHDPEHVKESIKSIEKRAYKTIQKYFTDNVSTVNTDLAEWLDDWVLAVIRTGIAREGELDLEYRQMNISTYHGIEKTRRLSEIRRKVPRLDPNAEKRTVIAEKPEKTEPDQLFEEVHPSAPIEIKDFESLREKLRKHENKIAAKKQAKAVKSKNKPVVIEPYISPDKKEKSTTENAHTGSIGTIDLKGAGKDIYNMKKVEIIDKENSSFEENTSDFAVALRAIEAEERQKGKAKEQEKAVRVAAEDKLVASLDSMFEQFG